MCKDLTFYESVFVGFNSITRTIYDPSGRTAIEYSANQIKQ